MQRRRSGLVQGMDMDRVITASAAKGTVNLVAGITTNLVAEARSRHDLSPTATAAVGRLMTAATLLGTGLERRERVTLQIVGDGPIGSLTADAWTGGPQTIAVRGYARNPQASVPLNARGKFDVAGVIGKGHLQLTRSYAIGQPYVGVVPLVSGEIGEDLAGYFADSQQIPSVVALGVLADPQGIAAAGGVVAQLLPGAEEDVIAALEAAVRAMPSITQQVSAGATPEDLLHSVASTLELKIYETIWRPQFSCQCSIEKVETALSGLGVDELRKLASEQSETDATCEFCKHRYVLSSDEVLALADRIEAAQNER